VNVRTRLVGVAVSTGDHPGTTRYARCRTTCTSVNVTHHALAGKTAGDLGKRATATFWGSSGRRFKSCQPDQKPPPDLLRCDGRQSDDTKLGSIWGPVAQQVAQRSSKPCSESKPECSAPAVDSTASRIIVPLPSGNHLQRRWLPTGKARMPVGRGHGWVSAVTTWVRWSAILGMSPDWTIKGVAPCESD
jgi:hypothetical protein